MRSSPQLEEKCGGMGRRRLRTTPQTSECGYRAMNPIPTPPPDTLRCTVTQRKVVSLEHFLAQQRRASVQRRGQPRVALVLH